MSKASQEKAAKKANLVSGINDIDSLVNRLSRTHGDGVVMVGLGSIIKVQGYPYGAPTIDRILGSGIPVGRIIEIFGPESSGKTTVTLGMIKACQQHYFPDKQRNGVAAFIDAEHALDPEWAQKIGVDIDKLLVSQPDSGEQAFQVIELMVRSKLVDLIIVDSVAALVPQSELNGEVGDANVGAQARMISQGLRVLTAITSKSKCTIVFINQLREKIGVMFGNPETTPGGRALKFYSSVRMEVRKGDAIKDGDEIIGYGAKVKTVKNKLALPFQSTQVNIGFGHSKYNTFGVDEYVSTVNCAIDMNILSSKGAIKYNDTYIGSGIAHAARELRSKHASIYTEIKNKIYEQIVIHTAPVTDEHEDTDNEELPDDSILDG